MTDGSRYLEYPGIGAIPNQDGRTTFRVWAPGESPVRLRILGDKMLDLEGESGGYHQIELADLPPRARYLYVMPDGSEYPDPASRSQPDGIYGPSEVFDPAEFSWSDGDFQPPGWWQFVIYELHIGTFTTGGTLDSAAGALGHVAELGANAIEPMPVAQFPGARNWGYDGVFPFAVHDTYGGPKALQRFVDVAHGLGLAVVLDVVYNHLGPEGNVFGHFGPYFTDRYRTPWGPAVNVDGPESDDVRRYFIANALGWFTDFHIDALRLDAVHEIVDTTARPFLLELSEATQALSGRLGRPLHLIAESADNNPRVVSPASSGGLGLGAQWNDDFHHALHAAMTGESGGYYVDFGDLQQVAVAMTQGFVFQGQHSKFRKRRHGAPSANLEPQRLVVFDQNHDQIGNRPRGDRPGSTLSTDRLRLSAAVVLLSPYVPLLFMGEEYAENAPFPYFVDHSDPDLLQAVRKGRAAEMRHNGFDEDILDPTDPRTFELARIDLGLRHVGEHAKAWKTFRALIELRRSHGAFGHAGRTNSSADVPVESVLQISRRGPDDVAEAVAWCNFGDGPVELRLPDHRLLWRRLADSATAELGGSGSLLPGNAAGGDSLELGPASFCVYGS